MQSNPVSPRPGSVRALTQEYDINVLRKIQKIDDHFVGVVEDVVVDNCADILATLIS